jgi:hypothetical protein
VVAVSLPRMKITADTMRVAIVLTSAIPFVFFWGRAWMHAALIGYLMTALFFCAVLPGEYPPFASGWFWKAMIPIVLIHCALVTSIVLVDLEVPYMNKMPRALYGLATTLLVAEWRLSLRIIDACEPSTR